MKKKCINHECINMIDSGSMYCKNCQDKFVLKLRKEDVDKFALSTNYGIPQKSDLLTVKLDANNNPIGVGISSPTSLGVISSYPKYYRCVADLEMIDVYQVHKLFGVNDPSGAIQHASKKLLLSGMRTGNKSQFKDIKEARDTLSRWLEMNSDIAE